MMFIWCVANAALLDTILLRDCDFQHSLGSQGRATHLRSGAFRSAEIGLCLCSTDPFQLGGT